jgi:hypothetical protein
MDNCAESAEPNANRNYHKKEMSYTSRFHAEPSTDAIILLLRAAVKFRQPTRSATNDPSKMFVGRGSRNGEVSYF